MRYEDPTPPESLTAMRRSIDKNTAIAQNALNWSARTYNLVEPIANVMAVSRKESRYALAGAMIAVLVSFVGLACELVK